ncbi:MAG TPA: MlaD family protein, partial [Mycobacterium sp.]
MRTQMKSFSERNPIVIGSIGVIVLATTTLLALQYRNLPFFNPGRQYSAYFSEIGGLTTDSSVQVSGFEVGKVSSIDIDGARVLVKFRIDDDVALGDRTEAAIQAKTALGSKI